MSTICSSARAVAAVVEEEEEEAVVEKAEAVAEVVAVEAAAVEAVAVAAVVKVALEALAVLEIDLPAPTSVAQLVEEADPDHSTAAASSTAVARELLTPPVLEAP
jgi:hypothetical protein